MCGDSDQKMSEVQKVRVNLVIEVIQCLDVINKEAFYTLVKALYSHSNISRSDVEELAKKAVEDFWNEVE